jgi:hypothetical protein
VCISFSDRLKFTKIGESTATVVRRLFCGETYVPSCCWAAPVMPATGETIVQYERLSFAVSRRAFASSTAAA